MLPQCSHWRCDMTRLSYWQNVEAAVRNDLKNNKAVQFSCVRFEKRTVMHWVNINCSPNFTQKCCPIDSAGNGTRQFLQIELTSDFSPHFGSRKMYSINIMRVCILLTSFSL
jgi:hypothetical protein